MDTNNIPAAETSDMNAAQTQGSVQGNEQTSAASQTTTGNNDAAKTEEKPQAGAITDTALIEKLLKEAQEEAAKAKAREAKANKKLGEYAQKVETWESEGLTDPEKVQKAQQEATKALEEAQKAQAEAAITKNTYEVRDALREAGLPKEACESVLPLLVSSDLADSLVNAKTFVDVVSKAVKAAIKEQKAETRQMSSNPPPTGSNDGAATNVSIGTKYAKDYLAVRENTI